MKTFNLFKILKTILFVTLVAAVFTACSNSAGGDDHEHEEPEGFRLKINDVTVIEQLPDQAITGSISLRAGETTSQIVVYFIDHDGDEFQPDAAEYSIAGSFDVSGTAEFQQAQSSNTWGFYINGLSEGNVNLTLELLHGTHSDFTRVIPVTVTPAF